MSKPISKKVDEVRIQIDSIIKKVDEKYGMNLIWTRLCHIKDDLGMVMLDLKEEEAIEEKE